MAVHIVRSVRLPDTASVPGVERQSGIAIHHRPSTIPLGAAGIGLMVERVIP